MLAEHDAQGSANTSRGFQGARPSLYDFESDIRRLTMPALIVVGDEDERCIEPSLFLKNSHRRLRAGDVSQDRPCGEPGGAGPVQPGGRRFSHPRRCRPLAAARSAVDFAEIDPDGTLGGETYLRGYRTREPPMLKWAFVFLLIAIVAGLFGFTGVEQASATIAQWLFGIFLVLFVGALVTRPRSATARCPPG